MRRRRTVPSPDGTAPRTVSDPPVGFMRPSISLMLVVFPEPFGPIRPKMLPVGTVRHISSSACTCPYDLLTPSISITFMNFLLDHALSQKPACASPTAQ